MRYEQLHWSIFNVFARLFGFMAALASVAAGCTALLEFRGASHLTPGVGAAGNLLLSVFLLALAVCFLTVRPYRPDIARERLSAGDTELPKLRWWTGALKE